MITTELYEKDDNLLTDYFRADNGLWSGEL